MTSQAQRFLVVVVESLQRLLVAVMEIVRKIQNLITKEPRQQVILTDFRVKVSFKLLEDIFRDSEHYFNLVLSLT